MSAHVLQVAGRREQIFMLCLCLPSSETERAKNPMVELFYGHFLAVGVLEGEGPDR